MMKVEVNIIVKVEVNAMVKGRCKRRGDCEGSVGRVGHSRVDHQIRRQAGRVEEMQPVVLESRPFPLWC